MQRHKVELQPAFVLHTRRFRETSLIVELFTPEHGRVGVVAKGAGSGGKSSRKALLQPFSRLRVSWVIRGELGTLTAVEQERTSRAPTGRAVACGFYLNELLMRLLIRHDPHPLLFTHYEATLQRILVHDEQAQTLRAFEKQLLEEIGYGLILGHEAASGVPIDPDLQYHYRPEEGPIAIDSTADAVEDAVSGRTLLALAQGARLDSVQLSEARRLLQGVLRNYLGDRPLRSRELLKAFQ